MRYQIEKRDLAHVAEIADELGVVRPGRCAIATIVPKVRQLLELDHALVLSPIVRDDELRFELFHADGIPDVAYVERLFASGISSSPPRYAWYDPTHPEVWQRNRIIDARDLMSDEELAQTPFYQDTLRPAALHTQRQPRVLICEGSSLLAWFGGFHSKRVEPRQRALLRRLIAPMRSRLIVDRMLARAMRQQVSLHAALDELGAPTMILGRDGRVHETNAAARALCNPTELAAAAGDAIAGRPPSVGFDLIKIEERGTSHGWLAVANGHRDERVASSIAIAAQRWRVTARQLEVLQHVVAGRSNVSIALDLRVSQRAVELHVAALFERAGVGSRCALVAAVLGN